MLFLICKQIRASVEKVYRSSGKSFQKSFFPNGNAGFKSKGTVHAI